MPLEKQDEISAGESFIHPKNFALRLSLAPLYSVISFMFEKSIVHKSDELKMDLLFLNVCKNLEIQEPVGRKWLDKIRTKLTTESQRHYHNWDIIDSKYKFVECLDNVCVLLAIFFQYFEFDVRRNCVEENCLAFEEFVNESGLNDVSMSMTS